MLLVVARLLRLTTPAARGGSPFQAPLTTLLHRIDHWLFKGVSALAQLFLIGAVVCCYNIWMTVRSVPLAERRERDVPAAVAVPGE